ncbi:double-strand break repair helicase AddA [Brevundimonas lutea]|uniref:double-strand break repair helicase AddA n=1 Tax=Brevundimonas lutea TaxID=2293980 RepID=UPI000F01C82C|nr:double-strand break repair helicase AddA [Brevundimonas lutea]
MTETLIARDPQTIAADPTLNAFVMANAGSGKTKTLVDRVARLLLAGSAPAAILCLTFTKAAAAEMQRRLYQKLGAWAVAEDAELARELRELEGNDAPMDAERLSRARRLFARALETPGGLKIQTIHAFCEQLLRRFPVEARVSPRFTVIDEVQAAAIRARARDRVAEASLDNDPPGLTAAYERFAGQLDFKSFEGMFLTFEAKRDAIAAFVDAHGGIQTLPDRIAQSVGFERYLDADPDKILAEVFAAPDWDEARWREAARVLADASAAGDQKRGAQMLALAEAAARGGAPDPAVLTSLFFTGTGSLATWCGKSAAAKKANLCDWLLDEQARIGGVLDRLRAVAVAEDSLAAMLLAHAYAGAYEAAKAESGALDFSDLIAHARWLLTDGPGAAWVLYKLDGGIDHILIDEAQDTSPEQWDIARALTAEFFAGAGARADLAEQRRGRTVFVVGDEKQSIFSFQGAAPERLLAESQAYDRLITGAGGRFQAVELIQSWRSTPEVLAFVDRVFATPERASALSPGRGLAGDPADPVIRHEAGRRDLPGLIEVWPVEQETKEEDRDAWDAPVDAPSPDSAYRRAAMRIVEAVKRVVETGEGVHAGDRTDRGRWRPAGYGDVLVLVKKRGAMFEAVLRGLKQAGVPVAGADRLRLSEHPVFEDLLALGRAALYPADDLTLAGVLRSPLCDIDENGLFDLAHGRKGSLWSALVARAGERPEWAAARTLISGFAEEAGRAAPFDLYARLLARTDGTGLSVRQRFVTRLGAEAGDALDAFLDQAQAAEGRGLVDLERFTAALAELDQTVKREMDQPRGEVRVMTAHASKGLEAPIVILPDTLFQEPRGDALLATDEGGFLWCASQSRDCAASAVAREARKRRSEEESLRLLYVGLTRARDRLIVGGRLAANRTDTGVAWRGPLEEAITGLDGRSVETEAGVILEYGQRPPVLGHAAEATSDTHALPAWLAEPPPREAGARHLSPSRLLGSEGMAAPSPLARGADGRLDRYRRGDLIHRLLQTLPEVAAEARAALAERLLAREPGLGDDARAEMIAAALAVLDDARFAAVFGPGSRAEVALAGAAEALPPGVSISGRIDRLVVTPDRVLVIDFKTNRPAPDRIEDAAPAYVLQLAAYRAVLSRLYHDRPVEAALVWTDGPKLMEVPAAMMDDALLATR